MVPWVHVTLLSLGMWSLHSNGHRIPFGGPQKVTSFIIKAGGGGGGGGAAGRDMSLIAILHGSVGYCTLVLNSPLLCPQKIN